MRKLIVLPRSSCLLAGDSSGGTRIELRLKNSVQINSKDEAIIKFGDVQVTAYRIWSTTVSTTIWFRSPPTAVPGEVSVTVTSTHMGDLGLVNFGFEYTGKFPTTDTVSPHTGYAYGNYHVRLQASYFPRVRSKSDIRVFFGPLPAVVDWFRPRYLRDSDGARYWQTEIRTYAPVFHGGFNASTTIYTSMRINGIWTNNATIPFIYKLLPSIAETAYVSRRQGTAWGGEFVRVLLRQFWPATSAADVQLTIAGTSVSLYRMRSSVSQTTLDFYTPSVPHVAGSTRVEIKHQTSTALFNFTFESTLLKIEYIAPSRGTWYGRYAHLKAKNFMSADSANMNITLESQKATIKWSRFHSRSRTGRIGFIIPYIPGISSTQVVTGVLMGGGKSVTFSFKYIVRQANAPRILSVSPNSDTACGGRTVRLDFSNPPAALGGAMPALYFAKQPKIAATKINIWGRKVMVNPPACEPTSNEFFIHVLCFRDKL